MIVIKVVELILRIVTEMVIVTLTKKNEASNDHSCNDKSKI